MDCAQQLANGLALLLKRVGDTGYWQQLQQQKLLRE
jgi:hypothetical protein